MFSVCVFILENPGSYGNCCQKALKVTCYSLSYLCLINGILIQFAAATAAKGTKRPISGETCCGKRRDGHLNMANPGFFFNLRILT